VGKLDREHIIFPPVDCKAEIAALIDASNAGSGFFIRENRVGSWESSEEILDLVN
jgi:hypothetical protein